LERAEIIRSIPDIPNLDGSESPLYALNRLPENGPANAFRARVIAAAEAALKADGSVGPLELFQRMGVLPHGHFEAWRKGVKEYDILERWIQLGPEKFQKTLNCLAEWVQARGLRPVKASYTRRTPHGDESLQVTENPESEREAFYHTHYAPADLKPGQSQRLAQKLNKPRDLVVFEKVSHDGACSECGVALEKGSLLSMEKGQPLCLACADLDHLVFLPAGDMALTRRARKRSQLSAVVVRFSRSRKRYERQGLLVTESALNAAETECANDSDERATRRAQAAVHRGNQDARFVESLTEAIRQQFGGCPTAEAKAIAEHTGLRGSGRVGRSAPGRELAPDAIRVAVIAYIRHQHTNYDELLMEGFERLDARTRVRARIEEVLANWAQS
jgi:hypothetical protein